MSDTGRYYIKLPSGRTFCVEPLAARDQKIDGHAFTNGGIDGASTKNKQSGGAIREADSVITEENGFKNIVTLPPGVSPNGFIEALSACTSVEEENALLDKYRP